jgi:hypothetical protein
MSGRLKALLTIAGLALAMPATAQVPTPTTAFDGNYVGVSAHIEKSTGHGRQCPREHAPDPLTITSGVVHSAKDRWTGTVGPEGNVTLRNRRGMRVDAQIDAQGAIKGRYQGPACFVDYVWHKRGA